MSDKFFLDTNIIVYSFEKKDHFKSDISRSLIKTALSTGTGGISFQVIQEFLNAALRKFEKPFTPADAKVYIQNVLEPLCLVYSTIALYNDAVSVHGATGYSFYDSLIIASAKTAGCNVLFSEDMLNGFVYESITIRNPFLKGAA